jgi:small-conductance mechanosensitive channel
MKKTIRVCLISVLCLLQAGCPLPVSAQQQSTAQPVKNQSSGNQAVPDEEAVPSGEVVIDGNLLLKVYEPVATLTPEARAQGIELRIIGIARDSSIPSDSVRLQPREAWTEIIAGNIVIMAITDGDARGAGETRQQLALEEAQNIRLAIEGYRLNHSWRMILRGILKTVLVTLLLVAALWLVRRLRLLFRSRIERRMHISAKLQKKSAWHLSVAYLGPVMLAVGTFLRWVLILGLLQVYLTVTLGFYSSTREISLTATRWVSSQLESLAKSGLDYLPNLVIITVIVLVTSYLIRLIRLVFSHIGKGDLKIPGFYPDWAAPTDKLIRALVLVLALIVAFPYLPGAKSPAFRGISIFLGVLLSLGSSSAVANTIAGVILTYMRSFLAGDWVQIGDNMGEVVERTLLVTRILTPKAEVITIPNSTVMSGPVKNYSTEANKSGVIFYTSISISFDVPWRTVHQLLINAASATAHVLRQPAPFVLQRSIDDFYVTYELNAYTKTPREVLNIYSDLHQNIQDKFNEAGVEICSPHYSAIRDGNSIAIPEQYIAPDYKPSGFRLNLNKAESNAVSR